MVADHAARHEMIDARVWDGGMRAWWPLAPWEELTVEGRADWTVTKASITVGAEHPQAARLRAARHQPVPVSFAINGVRWDGYVDDVETGQREDGTRYVVARMSSESKHFHRMLARGPVVSAADDTAREVRTTLGAATRELVSDGAARTGLPTYVIIDDSGDMVELEVRTEDYVADVLDDPLAGSNSFVEVRKLMPGDPLPGVAQVEHYSGALERRWEDEQLAAGAWPQAQTHDRLTGRTVEGAVHMPRNSWRGTGDRDIVGKPQNPEEAPVGVCWVPFDVEPQLSAGYYTDLGKGRAGVFSATPGQLENMARKHYPGRPHHVTLFMSGTLTPNSAPKLSGTAASGLLNTPTGQALNGWDEVNRYIAGGWAYAWHTGGGWVLANQTDFDADQRQYEPRGRAQKQTPGVLVWQHAGRDRRGVVFSSSPGGGLAAWSTTETGADSAMIIAGGQLDQQTISRLQALGRRPLGVTGELEPGQISAYTGDASMIERVDVDAQPSATIEGTDVSYSTVGARVNIRAAGPFFLREKYMNLSSSGVNPVSEIGREWAQAQGSTSIKLTPGHHQTVVFGDDVRAEDGRIIPGWKPGDRVSFVDGDTRVSEVIMGYEVRDTPSTPFTATPILGRQVNGVLADLGRRLRVAERTSTKAYLQPPRRLGQPELLAAVDDSYIGDGVRQVEKNVGAVRDLLYTELGGLSSDMAALRREMEAGLDDGSRLMGSLADAVGKVSEGTKWAGLEGDDLAQAIIFTLQAQDTLNHENLSFNGFVSDQLRVQAILNDKQGEWNQNTETILDLLAANDEIQGQINRHQDEINAANEAFKNQQLEINDARDSFEKSQVQINDAVDSSAQDQADLIESMTRQLESLRSQLAAVSGSVWQVGTPDDGMFTIQRELVSGFNKYFLVVGGSWVGRGVVTFSYTEGYGDSARSVPGSVPIEVGTQRRFELTNDKRPYGVVVNYRVDDGKMQARELTIASQTAGQSYTALTSRFTTPTASTFAINVDLAWLNAHRGALYAIRIMAYGQQGSNQLGSISRDSIGPLGPAGNGRRTMTMAVEKQLAAGVEISIEAMCNHEGEFQRQVDGGSVNISWIV